MNRGEVEVKEFGSLIRHTVLVWLFLMIWLATAWVIDEKLMVWFPLEGLSMISFRLLEVLLHISTFRIVFKLLLGKRKQKRGAWWL